MGTILPKPEEIGRYQTNPHAMPTRAVPFILHFVRLLRWPLAANFICYAIGTMLMALEPLFFGRLVDALAASDYQRVMLIVGLFVIFTQIISRIMYTTGHLIEIHVQPMLMMVIRRHLAIYLFGHSYRYFSDDFVGRLGGKVMEMPQAVKEVINDILNPFQYVFITALTALVVFITLHWGFGVAVLVFFSVTGAVSRYYVPSIAAASEIAARQKQTLRGRYIDSIGGILLVKLFARAREEDRMLTQSLSITGTAEVAEGRSYRRLWIRQHIINALFLISVMALAIHLNTIGAISVGSVAVALGTSLMLAANVWWLLQTATLFFTRFATIDEALSTIMKPHEIVDAPNAQPLRAGNGTLAFNNVDFTYPNARALFHNLNITIPAGQRVGLVGYSGSGKTSFVRLILRLYDIQNGSITVDEQNIATVTQESLHSAISFIPQDPELFHRTVAENIAVGRPGASMDEIVAAARSARAHDFISALPAGYDSVVGERGVKLSGGQRQRIAIARVALRNTPILILDEATSALDSHTELDVQESLGALMQGRTTIVIAHRLATLKSMDRILVFHEGAIIEDGTLDELLRHGGQFTSLWEAQVGGFLHDKHTHRV
jgi:ABC-type multidrug transport system fused ATPase/permease subunit